MFHVKNCYDVLGTVSGAATPGRHFAVARRSAALGADVRRVEPYADLFHLDVGDAHFVPELLFFPDLIAALRPLTATPFHVHLMAERPAALVDAFINAGADMITVHAENGAQGWAAIEQIRAAGKATGLAIGLDTLVEAVVPYLDHLDLVLVMGTRLGMEGQDLHPTACPRIERLRRLLQKHNKTGTIKIGADGGIRQHTVPRLRAAGADLIVPGSLVFGSDHLDATFEWLRKLPAPLR